MKILFLGLGLIAFAGCSTTSQLTSIATPANVQVSITVLGGLTASKVTASEKLIVHTFATDLLSLAAADVSSSNIQILTAKIPASVSPYTTGLVAAAVADLNLALAKFGQKNATVLAYVNAVGTGLINAGF
jgi:hypothetical protein